MSTPTGCPQILRCDDGTENVGMGSAQIAFRLSHTDALAGEKSFMCGTSKHNIVSIFAGHCNVYATL